MAGYVYRGNEKRKEPSVDQEREGSRAYLSTRANDALRQRAMIALRNKHSTEYKKILSAIHRSLGPYTESRREATERHNIAKTVLARKYPSEFAAFKDELREEVYREFNYTPRPVGVNSKKGKYDDLIERLVRKDLR